MGLDAWLASVQERQRNALAGLGTFQQQVEQGIRQLHSSLDEAHRLTDEREPGRVQRMFESLDVEVLLEKVKGGNFSGFSRRERRAVPWLWRRVEPKNMAEFLALFPEGWPRLVRQRLRDWCLADGDSKHRHEWAHLAGRCPKDAPLLRWRLPVSIERALGPEGPNSVAARWADRPLREVVGLLGHAGLRPAVGYAGHVAAEYLLQRCSAREDSSEALLFLLDSEAGRAWLPNSIAGQTVLGAPVEARVAVIAAMLECRARGRVRKDVQSRIEERLIAKDSVFGDPRLSTLTGAWSAVRGRSKQAFEAFLSALIRQDLEFFFEKAMNEGDRHSFWLRYLGAIQSTTCWLAPDAYDALLRNVRTLPAEQQAAFRRARRFSRGEVSAFCLRFDEYSVIEFSDTGNATYVYRHSIFDSKVLGPEVESAHDLKHPRIAKERWSHFPGWEPRFEGALLELGIERGPTAPTRSR
ncbi:EH signature domain-containing protein [Myxococcus eversor]|uniref:EH signature domain-containing protein n=1 Tax=Myxococcus eversor TaxID=2709661 RepID=UPI0013D567E6|nr:EH signature domain-containing protein [Myxococcus eversor]